MNVGPGRTWIAAAVLAAALAPSAVQAWRARALPHLGIFHDDGIYLVTAKSIAEGNGYRIASLPGQPHQTKYPPLYPLWLSLAWVSEPSFPANLPVVALLAWLMVPLSIYASWFLLRTHGRLSLIEATALAAWVALNPITVMFGMLAMSELMSLALLAITLIVAERALRHAGTRWLPLMAGILGGAAFLARSAVFPLLVTAPLIFLWRRQRASAAWFAAGMSPFVFTWQAWAALHRASGDDPALQFYTDYFGYYFRDVAWSSAAEMIWTNTGSLVEAIGELLIFNNDVPVLGLTLSRLLAVAAVAGALRLFRRGVLQHYSAFGAAYALQLVFWNYPPTSRFLLPLLPLIAVAVYSEGRHFAGILRKALRKPNAAERGMAVIAGALTLALVTFSFERTWFGLTVALPSLVARQQRALEAVRPAYDWLSHQNGRVLAYGDPVMYLYTGRPGISMRIPPGLLLRGDRAAVNQWFASMRVMATRHGIDYVLLTPEDYHLDVPERSQPAWRRATENSAWSKQVFSTEGADVFRLERDRASLQ
jgi:hypothetical protein